MLEKKIVLASKSPRRIDILKRLGLDIIVIPSNVDEKCIKSIPPEQMVMQLALQKADSVAKRVDIPAVIIGADTIVVSNGHILGKPHDKQQAYLMLKQLQGKYHYVITGIALLDAYTGQKLVDYQKTKVKIKQLSEQQIIKYLHKEYVFDKAGSYAIQGFGSVIVEKIDGCYYNVVGLPVSKLNDMLKKFDIAIL